MKQYKSHKLDYSPDRILAITKGEIPNPVQCELTLSNTCNYRCPWCVFAYMKHSVDDSLPRERLPILAKELKELDVKSVVIAGTGEPFIYPYINEAIELFTKQGIMVAITTNGSLISEKNIPFIVEYCSWIRFSINGFSSKYSQQVNGVKKDYNPKIFETIATLNQVRRKNPLHSLQIGIQSIFCHDNLDEYINIIEHGDVAGADYYMLRPFYINSNNPKEINQQFIVTHKNKRFIYNQLEKIKTTTNMKIFLRKETEALKGKNRSYDICYALPFVFTTNGDGSVYNCFPERKPESVFCIGNLNKEKLTDIWRGKKHKKFLKDIMPEIDKSKCQEYCRHHAGNEYLYDIITNKESGVWV